MKEYSYCDIKKITSTGILFKDGFELLFEKCRNELPYFLFYSKKRVKILFSKKGIEARKRNENDFHDLQAILDRNGVSSYDMA